MNTTTLVRRATVAAGTAAALVGVTAGAASAHHGYVPMHSLEGPTSSANWFVVTAEFGTVNFGGYTLGCPEAADAGYAALEEAGMPLGIKIFEKMTIGDPKGEGWKNPNGVDGKGLEYFGAGSTLADDMLETWITGAESYEC